jgi:hypothetical protein
MPENTGTAILLNRVNGASGVVIAGHSNGIQTTEVPCLCWDAKTDYAFQSAAVALEMLSSSANDAAAGTGARTVLVESLDADYAPVSQIVTLDGVNAVALTGTHIAVNQVTVISSGSGASNAGNITLRVAGGGATQGYVLAGKSVQRAFKYTVPAGKVFVIDNFYLNAINAGGLNLIVTLDFNARLSDGTVLVTQTNYFSGQNPPFSITLPTGFAVQEKVTIYGRLTVVSANNANFAMTASGGLFTL